MDERSLTLTPHPYAATFPTMDEDTFAELLADIKQHGQREPIIVDQHNRIVDGIHRYRACIKLDIKIKNIRIDRRTLSDEEARDLIVSLNLHRRHLTTSQRAAIAAELANLKQGGAQPANLPDALSQADAAKLMQVSERATRSAVKVKREAPNLHARVKAGAIALHAAEKKLKGQPGRARATEDRETSPRPSVSADNKTIPAVYAPLFAELDALPAHLKEHPLHPQHAADLINELRIAIQRVGPAFSVPSGSMS